VDLTNSKLPSFDFAGKRVLLRVDFNIPIRGEEVLNDERMVRALPTINYLLEKSKSLRIITHRGRPSESGEIEPEFSVKPIANRLSELIDIPVPIADSLEDLEQDKKIIMLENIRFFQGEKDNSEDLAKALGKHGDVYIMDAFGTAHRKQSSTFGVIDSVAEAGVGFLVEDELEALKKILVNPKKPLIGIIGGSKISTKIDVIDSLTSYVDKLIIGGALANTCYKAMGKNIGKSLFEEDYLGVAEKLVGNKKIVLPENVVVLDTSNDSVLEKHINDIASHEAICDVGKKSLDYFQKHIASAKTIFWNGPLGKFEDPRFSEGTSEVAKIMSECEAYSIIGGGETITSFANINLMDSVDYASTAGGAFLEYIEKNSLPCIDKIIIKNKG
jgi:phosphoglycerate kinase